jgi:hypothetical protein
VYVTPPTVSVVCACALLCKSKIAPQSNKKKHLSAARDSAVVEGGENNNREVIITLDPLISELEMDEKCIFYQPSIENPIQIAFI